MDSMDGDTAKDGEIFYRRSRRSLRRQRLYAKTFSYATLRSFPTQLSVHPRPRFPANHSCSKHPALALGRPTSNRRPSRRQFSGRPFLFGREAPTAISSQPPDGRQGFPAPDESDCASGNRHGFANGFWHTPRSTYPETSGDPAHPGKYPPGGPHGSAHGRSLRYIRLAVGEA